MKSTQQHHGNKHLSKPLVVVMGGGTGIYSVTTALKQLPLRLATIINMADNGGSTGRIRDEFGFQPVGDLRQSLTALAEGEGQEKLRRLLLYRFQQGEGLKGHSLGNLILTALQDMTGSSSAAMQWAQHIFHLSGEVIPSTEDNVQLRISYEDGSERVGEQFLNPGEGPALQVTNVSLEPQATLNPRAAARIREAQVILIGPGDLFGSLLPTLLPLGLKEVVKESQAEFVYIANLVGRRFQTNKLSLSEQLSHIEAALGRPVDTIVHNVQAIPEKSAQRYAQYHEYPVENDLLGDARVITAELLNEEEARSEGGDALERSYLRHDSRKLKGLLKELIFKESAETEKAKDTERSADAIHA